MPDIELFKLILQGGCFALLAAGFIWGMVWLAPKLLADSKEKQAAWLKFAAEQEERCQAERQLVRQQYLTSSESSTKAIQELASAIRAMPGGGRPRS